MIQEQRQEHFLSLWVETKKILKHVCLCLKQWEPILTTREQQDADSTVAGESDHDAGALSGVCEALAYAQAKGLDLQTVLHSVSTGAAGSRQLDLFGPKILEGDYRPGFFMEHFIKDMKLALIESNISGLDLNVLSQVLAEYEELQAEGLGDEGTQALFKLYTQEKADE